MSSRTISTSDASPWCELSDGDLKCYLTIFNDDSLIPEDWHDEDDLIELQFLFDFEEIIQEMVDNRSFVGEYPDKEYFHAADQPLVDAVIDKLQACIDRLNKIVFFGGVDEDNE